ncbi:hypothetical protein GGQ86_005238 [Xanthobacter flavus]|uniref:Uncharacterized protein n=1 Tax=Xanthobacter flavus TaxID=281 RepID=A0A9W6CU02_XANFL|nr:hypothetical protein [Xanthobacter flavus]MDR6336734.1 hypothetical protein [Xanthobacter flavus]GLI25329.1 hypothetical protein XFLAVUS301_50030 [Xanthobacter flavus]
MRQASDHDVDQRRSRLIESACGKVEAGAPNFVDRVGNCVDHAGKSLDAPRLAHRRGGRDVLDYRAQALIVDGADEPASQPGGGLLEGDDTEAVASLARRR